MVRASKTSTPATATVSAPVDTTPAVIDASQKAAPKAPRAKKVVAKEDVPTVVDVVVVSPPAPVDAAAAMTSGM